MEQRASERQRAALLAVLAAALSLAASACEAETEPPAPAACNAAGFRVAIDVGHYPAAPGATSARGVPEWEFNLAMARRIRAELVAAGFTSTFLINERGNITTLADRPRLAAEGNAALFLSVHHDSVQPHYLEEWQVDGQVRPYSDRFSGHSLFYSQENLRWAESRRFAERLGTALLSRGLAPTLHHAEPIQGENRDLVDAERGIYRFDELGVLRRASMPAVLFECGVIVNRGEEEQLAGAARRGELSAAVVEAVQAFCEHRPEAGATAH